MSKHGLGYAIDHPLAIASQNKQHWPMDLLMEGVPYKAPPAEFICPDIAPDALDQDGVGACVAFAACTIANAFEHKDWGKWLFATGTQNPPTGAFLAYQWLKHGSPDGSFPGDGIPNVEGSFPEAVWQLSVKYGLPDAQGRLHRMSAYYSHSFGSDVDLAFLQQVLMQYGPVNVATMWPNNWFPEPVGPRYLRPAPSGGAGGHSFTIVGWFTLNGVIYLVCMNSWGYWGSRQGLFSFPASWLYVAPLGPQIIWKVVDIKDAPAPPPPEEVVLPILDFRHPQTVKLAIGVQCYKGDGVTPLVSIKGPLPGPVPVVSPYTHANGLRTVIVSIAGVVQPVIVHEGDCQDPHDLSETAVAAERDKWLAWLPSHP